MSNQVLPLVILTEAGEGYYKNLESALKRYMVGDNYGITSVIIDDEIDRGVKDFVEFAHLLHKYYPDLKELNFHQNYSYNENIKGSAWEVNLIEFIKILNLSYLEMRDCQSEWFKLIDWNNVLEAMPEGSTYDISSMLSICEPCPIYCTCKVPCTENKICDGIQTLRKGTRTLNLHID